MRFSYTGNWSLIRLFDLGEVSRGKSKHRPRDDVKLYNGPYPFIQTGDIRNSNLYVKSYNKTYSEFGLSQSKLWDEGTLCITIAANIAESAILSFKSCFPDSIIGFHSNDKTNNFFVKYYLDHIKQQLEILSVGCAQNNLNLEKLSKLKIYVPSLEEQNKIIFLLNIINDRIETQSKIIEDLKKQKNYINRFLFYERKEVINYVFEELFIEYKDLNTNNFEQYTIGKEGIKKILNSNFTYSTSKHMVFYANTLILGIGTNEIGVSINTSGCCSPIYKTYRIKNSCINTKYVYYFIDKIISLKKRFVSQKSTRREFEFDYRELNKLLIEVPTLETQNKYCQIMDIISYKIKKEEEVLNLFKKQKKYLLRNLFI